MLDAITMNTQNIINLVAMGNTVTVSMTPHEAVLLRAKFGQLVSIPKIAVILSAVQPEDCQKTRLFNYDVLLAELKEAKETRAYNVISVTDPEGNKV